ncbi:MAG: hypothetical protein H7318_02975 [Oligoflexus sp.]|nr:hypothetical protein [Oligoflexus sp.]
MPIHSRLRCLVFTLFVGLSLASCSSKPDSKETPVPKTAEVPAPPGTPSVALRPTCALPKSAKSFQLSAPTAASGSTVEVSFEDVRQAINSSCKSCHLSPGSSTGGFSYQDQLHGGEIIVGNGKVNVPGFFETAEQIRDVLVNGSMPPKNIRDQSPETYIALGKKLDQWIQSGKNEAPTAVTAAGEYPEAMWGRLSDLNFTDLGNCLPEDGKDIGTDPVSDYYFDQATILPDLLSDTDLNSMDSRTLSAKGTISYNVEYPLWNDHVQKVRHIHQPARIKEGKAFQPKPLEIVIKDKISEPTFDIPENTRFYKTFFRGVKETDGTIHYKPIETRIIVARNAPKKALFGTYIWREDGSNADLLKEPYRDGTAWKDHTMALDFNKQTGSKRNYLVPARHRCEQCHQGAPGENFVLGFTPLQINRRDVGEAGRDLPVNEDELNQVKRFVNYGMFTNITAAKLPKLEYFPASHILDDHTVRAQGYMVGNCAHCHNPKGFAKMEANIPMNLSAGKIYDFDTNLTSTFYSNKKIINHEGKLDQSYLFHRVADSDTDLKLESRMPLHSVASPDCRVVKLFSKWIKTYDPAISSFEVDNFKVSNSCTDDSDYNSGDVSILEQDPTESNGPYQPRRADWNDPSSGMSEWFKSLRYEAGLQAVSHNQYAVDWWTAKPECSFPAATLATDKLKDWMLKPGTKDPAKPLGQLYWTTAGAYFYNLTCTKCHGRVGAADGPLAGNLDKWSGGSIRVANFQKGLFGGKGENIKQFTQTIDSASVDLSGNYFIWMAYEGTKMNPPAQVADLLGTNKAQMLKTLIDRCARQIPSNPKATKAYFRDYDVFNDICTYNNWPVTDPRLQYDLELGTPLQPDELNKWLRQAASNTGWAIYDYVKSSLAKGKQQFPQTECENAFAP